MSGKVGEQRPPHGRRQSVTRSFVNAYAGISYTVRTQRNVRIHLVITALVLVAGVLLRVSPLELAVLLLCVMVVIVSEMLNTALECAVDLVTDEYHPLAKLSKDVSAGAVFVASIGAALVGGIVFVPRLWYLLTGELEAYLPAAGLLLELV